MNNKIQFLKDLKVGKKYENEFIKFYNLKDYKHPEGYHPQYDIECDNIKYEIKCDRVMNKTGNLLIEYAQSYDNKIPSGITTTQADYYIIFEVIDDINMEYTMYKIPTKKIKRYIERKKYFKDMKNFFLFDKNIFNKFIVN